jgi:chemotaxis protein methyltransferase CheR
MAVLKLEESDFVRIKDYILLNYGINLTKKATLIEGRLAQHVLSLGFSSFHDYTNAVFQKPDLVQQMVVRLTTNFTYFMREPIHYEFLSKKVLPEFAQQPGYSRGLKIWSAGCSTGDEAYTASITIHEFMSKQGKPVPYTIHATDIDDDVMAAAKQGTYNAENIKGLDERTRKQYFKPLDNEKFQIVPEITKHVTFSKLNLMKPFPAGFSGFHIIFCRNVMIYFTPETKKMVIQKFYDALAPGGYLILGLSEIISSPTAGLKNMKSSIYQKEG